MKNYKKKDKPYQINDKNKQTVIITAKCDDPLVTITVENEYKEVNLVPDWGGTSVRVVERDYSKLRIK